MDENSWEFREVDSFFNGPVDSAFFQSNSTQESLIIYGSSSDNKGAFLLKITAGDITQGSYTGTGVQFQYSDQNTGVYRNGDFSDLIIIIDQIDDEHLSGKFSGSVMDSLQKPHTISEGKFRCAINQISSGKRSLTVWTKDLCNLNNSIEIVIGNQSRSITNASSGHPSCNDAGAANFSLDPGTYELMAVCGNDTLIYHVSLDTDCSFLEVNMNDDYLPLGITSFWEYGNLKDVNVTQTFTADGEVDFNGITYTRLTGTRGNFYYFRKLPHLYYQYRELSFQDFVSNPPSVEIIILKDNLLKGQKWETVPLDIEISGVVQKIKLVSTILDRDYSAVINGVQYINLIKVNTELFFSPDNGNGYATSGSAFNTVFAKGKGIVSYNDMDVAIEWGIKNIFLGP